MDTYRPLIGGMNDYRAYHAAVALEDVDGRVLISGGEDAFFHNDSAEIFSPVTQTFTTVASMSFPRSAHSLTLLCDGTVLAAGGVGLLPSAQAGANAGEALVQSEIYDPVADTWTFVGNMATGRYAHTASLLGNTCEVLVVGGFDDSDDSLASAEIYDPVMQTWSSTVAITGVRGEARATTMANGNILVSGGWDEVGNTVVSTSMEYQLLKPNGDPCVLGADCESDECVDGVCCDTACTGLCEACTAALTGGGTDGTCSPIDLGLDPDSECMDQGVATCGTNGACDGSGECAVYALGTVCNPAACDGDDVLNADTCNGDAQAPACVDNATLDCGVYTCEGAVCNTDCVLSDDCAAQHYCDTTTSTCLPKLENGEPGVDPDQCLSGFLADGLCCDAQCDNGVCDACSVAAGASADGTCTAIITCSDDNACTLDTCDATAGCLSNNVLDGTACDDGICIAGTCIPDATQPSTSAAGGGGNGGAGAGDAGGSTSSAPNPLGEPRLEGGGICQATIAGGPTKQEEQPWWLLLGLVAVLRRRR